VTPPQLSLSQYSQVQVWANVDVSNVAI